MDPKKFTLTDFGQAGSTPTGFSDSPQTGLSDNTTLTVRCRTRFVAAIDIGKASPDDLDIRVGTVQFVPKKPSSGA